MVLILFLRRLREDLNKSKGSTCWPEGDLSYRGLVANYDLSALSLIVICFTFTFDIIIYGLFHQCRVSIRTGLTVDIKYNKAYRDLNYSENV